MARLFSSPSFSQRITCCRYNSTTSKRVYYSNQGQWTRLIRFLDAQGKCQYGEPLNHPQGIKQAYIIQGNIFSSECHVTDQVAPVRKLLAPLEHVPIFLGIGLNYRLHVGYVDF
jgi:hypothetical protein